MKEDRRLFVNAYGDFGRVGREGWSFRMRDPLAVMPLVSALKDLGYVYASTILNAPARGPDIRPVDVSYFRPTDLILQVTRPPLHDTEIGTKKIVPRSYTSLEETILFGGLLQTWFRTLNRKEVVLTPHATAVSSAISLRRTQEYVQYQGSMYEYLISSMGDKVKCGRPYARTAAYLVYTPHLWAGGPAFMVAFGLGGADTLTWCIQLANRFPHLLLKTPFAVAEMSTGSWPKNPDTIAFAEDRPVTILGVARPPRRNGTPRRRRGGAAKLVASL